MSSAKFNREKLKGKPTTPPGVVCGELMPLDTVHVDDVGVSGAVTGDVARIGE